MSWALSILASLQPLDWRAELHSQSTHLTPNQFNWLGTIFYLAYLAFEYPQNLALQYFPVGKWMTWVFLLFSPSLVFTLQSSVRINIFIWAIVLCCHAACTSFGGLFAVRFIMGVCEGAITSGFLIVTSMFYTRKEQTVRVGYWCTFLSFLLRIDPLMNWRQQSWWTARQSSSWASLLSASYTWRGLTSNHGSGQCFISSRKQWHIINETS